MRLTKALREPYGGGESDQDESQLATLYTEFAEEDQKLAEEGLDEYAELLRQEDLK